MLSPLPRATKRKPKNTMTAELQTLINNGWAEKDALEIIAERRESEEREALMAEKTRLDALDTSEWGELQMSAHDNALDTCSENGLPRDYDSTPYLRWYVATLSMLLDEAGIAH